MRLEGGPGPPFLSGGPEPPFLTLRAGLGRAGLGRTGPDRAGPGWNLGRTDLRINQSKAKFDARADGDVRFAVRRPKPRKIRDAKIFDPKILRTNFFRRRKIKCWESSETRFRKFWCRSEPSLRCKRPSKVVIAIISDIHNYGFAVTYVRT